MSRLAELQQQFQQCLLVPPTDGPQAWVRAGGRAAAERQLAVYIHAYAARLKEVLASDYPAVLTAIGEDAFERLSQAYLESHPSHFFSLRDFGARLAPFIAGKPAYSELPWLVELARFEWALGQAFDAADSAICTIDDMAAIAPKDWPDLRFDFHPSLQRLDLRWNITGMWASLTAERPTPVTATANKSTSWLVWREQLTTRFRSLSADEQAALDCARAGGGFGEICERLTAFVDADAVPLRAATLLKNWLERGLITKIRPPQSVCGI
jgi:hypothetical protein